MRLKTNSNFRLTKRTKTILAIVKFSDPHVRGAFKSMMIDAQVAAAMPTPKRSDRS